MSGDNGETGTDDLLPTEPNVAGSSTDGGTDTPTENNAIFEPVAVC